MNKIYHFKVYNSLALSFFTFFVQLSPLSIPQFVLFLNDLFKKFFATSRTSIYCSELLFLQLTVVIKLSGIDFCGQEEVGSRISPKTNCSSTI